MNPITNTAATITGAAAAPTTPPVTPVGEQVGEQALTSISTVNSGLGDFLRGYFPNLARSDRMMMVNGIVTVCILLGALLLYKICGRLRSRFMQVILRAGIIAVAIGAISAAWIPQIFDWFETSTGSRVAGSALTIFGALVVSTLVWEGSTRLLMNYYMEQAGAKSQRLRTLLPLFRRAILVLLILLTTLTIMTELGINIAPLLAGAGVIGLAIGFGAQNLVKDFITGLFIVLEDAISLGDVVTVGAFSGVVEDMTLRTVRLRDIHGAVHILPFSEVRTISNKSKSYAFAVIDIGVAYDTDLDKVGDVVHSVMAHMKEDPDWRDAMIDDVEIFGVEQMSDSAIIYRFRQRCPAARQWELKREILRRIRDAFAEEKIEIPFPTITHVFNQTPRDRFISGLQAEARNTSDID